MQANNRGIIRKRMNHFVREANVRVPAMPYLGFGFWFAWNLVAFSGSVWNTQEGSAILISYLFIAHLAASVATLVVFALSSQKGLTFIMTTRALILGAVIGTLGTFFMILVGGGYIQSIPLFIVGAALAGIGTSFLLIRSATILGLVSPRQSFLYVSLCALFAIAVYFITEGYASVLGAAFFALMPVFSALSLTFQIDSPQESAIIHTETKLPTRFGALLLAIFVYSLCQETTKSYLLTDLPSSQSVQCMRYVMLALIILQIVLIVMSLASSADFSLGRIFYPLALCFIVLQLCVPFLSGQPVIASAIIDFAGYAFDLLVWSICAYLAYQMQANCVKFMCLGTAALSAGLAGGSVIAIVLLQMNLSSMQFNAVNLSLAVLSIIVTVFVFPEKKLEDLLLPVDEPDEQDDAMTVKTQKALWKRACEEVALEGGLSARESEVFMFLAKGMTAQEIADALFVSIHTVRAHIRKIHTKLCVSSRSEIIALVEARKQQGH